MFTYNIASFWYILNTNDTRIKLYGFFSNQENNLLFNRDYFCISEIIGNCDFFNSAQNSFQASSSLLMFSWVPDCVINVN